MSRIPAFLLGPVVLVQASRLRARTTLLPEADGPRTGSVAGPRPLRLLVVGDSTAVGTGVARMAESLASRLASLLAESRGVQWRAVGRSGDTSGEVLRDFADPAVAEPFDLAVVLVGWNDAMKLRSGAAFARDLGALLDRLQAASADARLVVVAPPAFGDFVVLPQPLRLALGAAARGLARVAAREARHRGAVVAPGFDGRSVASDGFHPDATGYAALASGIATALSR